MWCNSPYFMLPQLEHTIRYMTCQVPPILVDHPYHVDVPCHHKICHVLLDGWEEYNHHGSLMNEVY